VNGVKPRCNSNSKINYGGPFGSHSAPRTAQSREDTPTSTQNPPLHTHTHTHTRLCLKTISRTRHCTHTHTHTHIHTRRHVFVCWLCLLFFEIDLRRHTIMFHHVFVFFKRWKEKSTHHHACAFFSLFVFSFFGGLKLIG